MSLSAARRGERPGPRSVSLHAPAKLNLGLRLVGLREDGYHLLESVFCPIDVWDEIDIELLPGAPRIELEVVQASAASLPSALSRVSAGPDNLVFRAAEAFCRARRFDARIRIRLEKGIPAAAGLGGGSSDAAAVLNGLATLAGEAAPPRGPGLDELALELGADVPFFLNPQLAHVSGIGEVIRPLQGLVPTPVVVINPGISLDTAEVYRAADALGSALTGLGPGSTMRAFSRLCGEKEDPRDDETASDRTAPSDRWRALLVNDLQPAALRLCPPIGRWLSAMRQAGAMGEDRWRFDLNAQ